MIFIALLFALCRASALQQQLTYIDPQCACPSTIVDTIEKPMRFSFGKSKGLCIDSCRYRPAQLLANAKANSSEIYVANILHYGFFYKGKIQIEKLDRIEMGFEEFLPGIYHVFLQFHVKESEKPIILVNQSDTKKPTIQARSFVLSAEGVPPQGREYSLFESYLGYYLLVTRIATGEETTRWTKEKRHQVKIMPLDVSPQIAAQIFFHGVEQSHNRGTQNIYQLFTNNCSTSALSYIDMAIGTSGSSSSWMKFEDALPIAGPFGTVRSLEARKLIPPRTSVLF